MSNPANTVTIVGNLAADPKIFANADGSRTIKFAVYARDNFMTKGEYRSQVIDLEAYFSNKNASNGIYPSLTKGSTVAVSASLRSNRYKDKAGNQHFDMVVRAESIAPIGPRKAAAPAQAQPQAQAPVQQVAPVAQAAPQPVQSPAQAPQVAINEPAF